MSLYFTCTVEGANPGKHQHATFGAADIEAKRLAAMSNINGRRVIVRRVAEHEIAAYQVAASPVVVEFIPYPPSHMPVSDCPQCNTCGGNEVVGCFDKSK